MDRPPADPSKLLAQWMEWEKGETPPGRVIANLKTGGLRELLEHLALSRRDGRLASISWPPSTRRQGRLVTDAVPERGGRQLIPRPATVEPGEPAPWAALPASARRLAVDDVRAALARCRSGRAVAARVDDGPGLGRARRALRRRRRSARGADPPGLAPPVPPRRGQLPGRWARPRRGPCRHGPARSVGGGAARPVERGADRRARPPVDVHQRIVDRAVRRCAPGAPELDRRAGRGRGGAARSAVRADGRRHLPRGAVGALRIAAVDLLLRHRRRHDLGSDRGDAAPAARPGHRDRRPRRAQAL